MVPDTATKWVLDYQYKIDETTGVVANIRNVLTKAKFRWQEIDVVNTSIVNTTTNGVVTIKLNEPLLRGLEWDVYYPAGAFTDMAGNPAAACGGFTSGNTNGTNDDYHFTSYGVQPPVIRVNRRSYDGRNSNWTSNTIRTYDPPDNTTNWSSDNTVIKDNGLGTDTGWGIEDFNSVHYRVESESKNAVIQVGISQGTTSSTNRGAARGSFTNADNISVANTGATIRTDTAWNTNPSNTPGTWVLSNIIRRSRNGTDQTYTINNKNGMPEKRVSNGTFSMYRSYNRDLMLSELGGIGLSASTNGYQGVITFNALEASKSYVAASAQLGSAPAVRGYEGVYRTIIIINLTGQNNANNYIPGSGSNIKNGTPSTAGFPLSEGDIATGDNRFYKVFFHNGGRTGYYWVSTEIVNEWYFIGYRGANPGSFQHGDVNNHFMVGYGDMTYCRHAE
jgi:hypothetical protein